MSEYRDKSLGEIISSIAEEELDKYPEKNITRDDLMKITAKHGRRKRKRFIRTACAAALFAFAVIIAGALVFAPGSFVNVDADKNPKEEIVTEDGVVVEDEGYGSGSSDELVITEWEEIENEYREDLQGILVPEYVPEGYEFEKMVMEDSEELITYIYTFVSNEGESFEIHQYKFYGNLESVEVLDRDKEYTCNKGTIYMQYLEENNKATIQMDGGVIIDIWGDFTDAEFIKIVDNLKPLHG